MTHELTEQEGGPPNERVTERITTAEERREFQRLRHLMVSPSVVMLATGATKRRWLTDKYALVDVTGSDAVSGVADGEYKLMATKGFEPTGNGGVIDLEGFRDRIEAEAEWLPVTATHWSIRSDTALLVYAESKAGQRFPLAISAQVWEALGEQTHFERDPRNAKRPFRVIDGNGEVVAYVMGVRIPDEDLPTAMIIVADLRERE